MVSKLKFLKRLAIRRKQIQIPSWITSLILHTAVLFFLAFLTLPLGKSPELSLQAVRVVEETVSLEEELLDLETDIDEESLEETIDQNLEAEPQIEVLAEAIESYDSAPLEVAEAVDFNAALSDFGDILDTTDMPNSSGLQGRSADSRANLLRRGGGTKSSEKAVLAGLDWLARHQYPDGSWNFDHTQSECNGRCGDPTKKYPKARAAATGLALMTYLGAGHTQSEGRYQRIIYRGIYALSDMVKLDKNGASFWDSQGRMYSQGIATMAICEAYAMTGDPALREPAQAAINYVCYAQDPNTGGWRYTPRTPRLGGDTSVMGWQIGALKSGYLSNLSVPTLVVQRAAGFLDLVMTEDGSRYYYDVAKPKGHHACTAIGALCRMYMGEKKSTLGIQQAVEALSKRGPSKSDVYYNYYTAQALFQYTNGKGPMWKKWNEKTREMLVATQSHEGHEAGSWKPQAGEGHGQTSGRLFTTAMNTMTLEVYYRMLPIYRQEAIEGEFESAQK